MKIIVCCEESQIVTKAFRKRGHEAYSCDIQDCSGGHPEWHIKGDALEIIRGGGYEMLIGHPPCTYLCNSGVLHLYNKDKTINIDRWENMVKGCEFFLMLWNSGIKKICLENPIMHGHAKKIIGVDQSQIIQPYYFGDEAMKTTALWLKGLPPLFHSKEVDLFNDKKTHVSKGEMMKCVRKDGSVEYRAKWNQGLSPSEDRGKIRSKTFPGIANAMAEQWG